MEAKNKLVSLTMPYKEHQWEMPFIQSNMDSDTDSFKANDFYKSFSPK